MSSQWFYIKRFKAARPNWYIARMHKKSGSIYLINNETGSTFKSDYYEARQLIAKLSVSGSEHSVYEIINEDDLDYIDKIFKKDTCDRPK